MRLLKTCLLMLVLLSLALPASGADLNALRTPLGIHGVNYYPRNSPWSLFWPRFKPAIIQTDLRRIRNLGFNTVRIFVPYQTFGGPTPDPAMLQRLRQLLDIAAAEKLTVIVTLFDFYTDYAQIEPARRHLQGIVSGFKQHRAIRAWDLKNEIDLDYPNRRTQVLNWLKTLSATLHGLGVSQPVTASVSRPEAAAELSSVLDYLTFHYYGPEADFEPRVTALRRQTRKPLVLGEYGFHTWNAGPDPHEPAHQFNYFQALQATALRQKLAGSLAWCLYDFEPALREPWVLKSESVQHHLGLLDLQSQAKAGLSALSQGVFIRDGLSRRALSLNSRRIELVLNSSQPTTVVLERRRGQQLIASQRWQLPAGVSTLSWTLPENTVRELIYLRERYLLRANGLLGPGQRTLPAEIPIELRRR